MPLEIYKRYRPTDLDQVVGQDEAVRRIQSWVKRNEIPHMVLVTGPSGTGKTTLARIIAKLVGVDRDWDFVETNGSDARGVDTIRDIRRDMGKRPMGGGKARVWYLDEVHGLTKDAQNAALKMWEDTPDHVYFILATTEPDKLLKTVKSRCSELPCKLIPPGKLVALVGAVAKQERIKVGPGAMQKLVDQAAGSARTALVLLEQLTDVEGDEEQCQALEAADQKRAAFDLVKVILPFNGKPIWSEVANVLADIAGEDPEGLRHMVLTSARSRLLKGGKDAAHCYRVLRAFERNFFDSKHAGLAIACYESVFGT
jgi:DNA polymerase III gamma/tau subunit